jgi:hypothetical protein
MSKYGTIGTEFRSRETICTALAEMGVAVEVHATPQPLVGWLGDQREERAEIIIRKAAIAQFTGQGSSNDMGLTLDADTGTYRAIISNFDKRGPGARLLKRLETIYQVQVQMQALEAIGAGLIERTEDVSGAVTLKLQITL